MTKMFQQNIQQTLLPISTEDEEVIFLKLNSLPRESGIL